MLMYMNVLPHTAQGDGKRMHAYASAADGAGKS
jgi:hypothetical protein